MKRYFGFNLDDSWESMWHEAERIQDGGSGHHIAFEADSTQAAARIMTERLIPFIEARMYQSDEDGYEV